MAEEIKYKPALMQARRTDLTSICSMLEAQQLPTRDLTAAMMEDFVVARDAGTIIGAVGIEGHPPFGLLRSLVTHPTRRGEGIGQALVTEIEAHARECGIASIYLLTTTARNYFERAGYRVISREAVPLEIRSTSEFRSLCPASATVMMKP